MKAAIYNPYLNTFGGGERYTLSFAEVLLNHGYDVDIQWESEEIIEPLEKRFGMKLNNINVVRDINRGDGYDLCFWVSDGSIPTLKSRKNILHFQVPFHGVNGRSLINKMKLFRINKIVCNSIFTKNIIDEEYGVDSIVVYPPVDTLFIKPKRKESVILFVGRFSELLQSKNQDLLVKNFRKLIDNGLTEWKLIIAGGVEVGADDFLERVKKMSEGYPIEIIQSPAFNDLKELYGKAKIFWSASGFGEDENKNPEKVEHFGMSVVEAMTSGAVPIVFKAGGHREIINDGKNGFLWTKESELLKITARIIKEGKLLREISASAKEDSKLYSKEVFEKEIFKLI